MWARLKTARDGHMSPIERAMVLGAAFTSIGLLALLFDEQKGPERFRIWEMALFVGVTIALGLMSSLRLWWRVPLYGALGTAVFIGTGVLAGRPHMLDAGVIVGSVLNSVVEGAGIGAIDLPPFWRRWANTATTSLGHMAKWSVYYVVTAVVWLCLLVSFDGLCDALVSTVLPSPKLTKSATEIGIGLGMCAVASVILLLGRKKEPSSRPLRVWQPAALGLLVVVLLLIYTELMGFVIAESGFPFPSWVNQNAAQEEARRWSTTPVTALGELLAVGAALSLIVVPLSIALGAWWDRARALGRRSRAISVLVPALLLVSSSAICGGIGLFIESTASHHGAVPLYNRVAAGLGLFIGGLLSWLWLRWTAVPRIADELTAPKYVSGATEMPDHVAQAVRASRETIP